jgi:hypothetical protein
VRDFAVRGAAVAEQADTETRAFLARAERARQARAELIQAMAERDIVMDTSLQFSDWAAQQAGARSSKEKVDLVNSLVEHSRQARDDAQQRLDDLRKKFDTSPVPIDATSQALAGTKKSFTVLAQELTPAEWASFSWKYLKQVRDAYRATDPQPASK